MRPPKNFDNKMNRRKQLLPEVPQATAADVGKIVKVSDSGAYELGEDENTIIIPNPDTTPSATLNALTIGSTTYKVNDARVTKILGLRFTIDNGGTYNANLPQISIVNEYGEAAVLPTNTMTCDKPVQYGALTPTGTPGVLNENLPAKITLAFAAEFNIEDYPNIKLTKGGLFPQDIAKNIKIEYTINDDEWVEIADLVSIDWTGDSHVYDMSTGEETETTPAIPTPTIADAGKFLGVDNNGAWELDNIPSELPAVTSADAGKVLTVDSQGAWGADSVPSVSSIDYYNADYDNSLPGYILVDKKINDIFNSVSNGRLPIIKVRNTSAPAYPLALLYVTNMSNGVTISISDITGVVRSYRSPNNTQSNSFTLIT